MRWISVDERLPEVHQDVLLWTHQVRVGWRSEINEWSSWTETFSGVSHWMPLPSPPDAGATEVFGLLIGPAPDCATPDRFHRG